MAETVIVDAAGTPRGIGKQGGDPGRLAALWPGYAVMAGLGDVLIAVPTGAGQVGANRNRNRSQQRSKRP